MVFQMAMVKILQFLGGVSRYWVNNSGKAENIDKKWEDAEKAWKAATSGKDALDPNKTYKGWYWFDEDAKINYGQAPKWVCEVIAPILNVLNTLLIPLIIILGVAGMIYGIVLGVQYSKAETADKREELKKRLISAVIGILIALVVLIVMKILIQNAGKIFNWVQDESGTESATVTPSDDSGSGDKGHRPIRY